MTQQSFEGRTSSGDVEIGTPDELFLPLHEEFNFTFDLAAAHASHLHKCDRYWTKEENSLLRSWPRTPKGEANWLNPPYSRAVGKWVAKARVEAHGVDGLGSTTVLLINANTESQWFQNIAVPFAHEIRLLEYRQAFIRNGVQGEGSYHPSCILVFYAIHLNIIVPPRIRGDGGLRWPRYKYVSF